jgi:hypothetical protein
MKETLRKKPESSHPHESWKKIEEQHLTLIIDVAQARQKVLLLAGPEVTTRTEELWKIARETDKPDYPRLREAEERFRQAAKDELGARPPDTATTTQRK